MCAMWLRRWLARRSSARPKAVCKSEYSWCWYHSEQLQATKKLRDFAFQSPGVSRGTVLRLLTAQHSSRARKGTGWQTLQLGRGFCRFHPEQFAELRSSSRCSRSDQAHPGGFRLGHLSGTFLGSLQGCRAPQMVCSPFTGSLLHYARLPADSAGQT